MGDPSGSISALHRLRKDFEEDHLRFPRLYYAVLDGYAFQRGGVAFEQPDGTYRSFENYIMARICNGDPWGQAVGYKYPRYFFFGPDQEEGAKRLNLRCEIANKIIRD